MILFRTWTLNRRTCEWSLQWLTAGARAKLPHVSALALAFACGGSAPPPPQPYQPAPAAAHVPPATDTLPPAAWQPPGSPWRFETPPDSSYLPVTPIPLGPVLEAPGGPEQTFGAPQFGAPDVGPPLELASVSPLCAPGTTPVTTPVSTAPAPVPEPAGLFIVGAVLLFLWKALKWA